jgi:uncharacterized protein with GYD domain
LLVGRAEDWEDDMTTFITQARFTKEGFNAMIAAPEDRAEIVGRLIAEVGGKLIAYYLTSGEYDIMLRLRCNPLLLCARPTERM